jgi:hypothetical protein
MATTNEESKQLEEESEDQRQQHPTTRAVHSRRVRIESFIETMLTIYGLQKTER